MEGEYSDESEMEGLVEVSRLSDICSLVSAADIASPSQRTYFVTSEDSSAVIKVATSGFGRSDVVC